MCLGNQIRFMRKGTHFADVERRLRASITALLLWSSLAAAAGDRPVLSMQRSPAGLELSWPAGVQKSDGSTERPYFEVQRSRDLRYWQPIGQRMRATSTAAREPLHVTLLPDEPATFYRLLSILPAPGGKLGVEGAEIFGYAQAFADELQRIGQISP